MWPRQLLKLLQRALYYRERKDILKVLPNSMEAQPPPAKRPCPVDDPDGHTDSVKDTVSAEAEGSPGDGSAEDPGKKEATFQKLGKRKKFAALLSYSGSGYNGMQK